MEIEKIKNFLMMFPLFSKEDFAIIGLEQMANGNDTYRIIAVPNATILSEYVCGGGVKRINVALQCKANISNVAHGGNVDVSKVFSLYKELEQWLRLIYYKDTYRNYYKNNKNEYVKSDLDYSNWNKLELSGQPNVIGIEDTEDTAIFTCMLELDYEF